jgi:glutamate synthase (NADPH) small chain
VIGGGDAALDCATVSLRLGDVPDIYPEDRPEKVLAGDTVHGEAPAGRAPGKVMIVYRRPKEQAPAHIADLDDGIAEGALWQENLAPVEVILDDEGRTRALRVVPVDWIDNRKMVPRDGEEFDIECSLIVGATGQSSDFNGFEEFDNGHGWIDADAFHGVKDRSKHFVGGDAVNPDLLTTAIGHGWKAAEGIDAFVRGVQPQERPPVDVHHFHMDADGPFATGWVDGTTGRGTVVHNFEDRSRNETQDKGALFLGHFEPAPINRRETKQLALDELVGNFEERLSPLTEKQVMAEAKRCMSCGLCLECNNCVVQCPEMAVRWVASGQRSMGRFVATDYARCVGCGICADVCPTGYIGMELTEKGTE